MSRTTLFLYSVFLAFLSFSVLSQTTTDSSLKTIQKTKKIKIAVDATYPPMEFEDDSGQVVGLDVDLAKELAKKIGVEAEFIVMPWEGILAGLLSNPKRYDIIMSTMNVTPEREKKVDFITYMKMGQIFIVRTDSPVITKKEDLSGKIVAVQADTTSSEALEKFIKEGVKIKEVKGFKSSLEALGALKIKQADVVITDEAIGKYNAKKEAKTLKVSPFNLSPEPVGIAVRKEEKALFDALNKAMTELKKSGKFDEYVNKWL